MTKISLLAAAALVAAGAAQAGDTTLPKWTTKNGPIVNQTSGGSGATILSENDQITGADAFTVMRKATVETVVANGIYFNGSGPATSETVTFYTNYKGIPGGAIKRCTYPNVKGASQNGTLTMVLKPACVLQAGIYWVSVVANVNIENGGEWGWLNAAETGPYQAEYQGGDCPAWCPAFTPPTPGGLNYQLLGKGS
jgi:hypothetical protein